MRRSTTLAACLFLVPPLGAGCSTTAPLTADDGGVSAADAESGATGATETSGDGDADSGDTSGGDGDEATGDGDGSTGDGDGGCPFAECVVIDGFPFTHASDTTTSPLDAFDSYACAPTTGEAGPERAYMFTLAAPGTILAMVDDDAVAGTDVDLHLLDGPSRDACVRRGHKGVSANLEPGTYYLFVDSWSDAAMTTYEGPYTLHVHFVPAGSTCAMLGDPIPRIGTAELLDMPATGMVVKEAHLVTDQDPFGGNGWPTTIDENVAAHYARTEMVTGYAMNRTEPWAPCCEPSNEFGQGSSVKPPVEAEAFYVNMRWSQAPPQGQRYVAFNALDGRAVIVAAGYENGPGDLSRIGGVPEEVHDHLGTGHLDHFTLGVAADQTLPFGPIVCGP